MIRLCLIDGNFSSQDDNLDLDTLMINKHDDVVLSCDEYYPTVGSLEKAAAGYVSLLLPHGYHAQWDGKEVSTRRQKVDPKLSNPRINELRFKLILRKEM